ncbi:MAG: hypothetical protein DRR11_19090 [Gammaproteobacteria bacterium]|nr:MAG: hypothetical protein DRR11_19090 [Gammaproteobacteria bacterium]
MATLNVASNNRGELIAQKASRRGMSINAMYGQFAITFSPERIDQMRFETGKLNPGVIALCGTLDEVDNFLQGVSANTDQARQV